MSEASKTIMKRIGASISPEAREALKAACSAKNVSPSEAIRGLMRDYTTAGTGAAAVFADLVDKRARERRDASINFYADPDEWAAFQAACRAKKLTPARVLQAICEVYGGMK